MSNFRQSCEFRTTATGFCGYMVFDVLWVKSPYTNTVIDFWVCKRHKKDQMEILRERGFTLVRRN